MDKTEYLKLNKPSSSDDIFPADIDDVSSNFDIIDNSIKTSDAEIETLKTELDNKVEKVTLPYRVYVTGSGGIQTVVSYSENAIGRTIPIRVNPTGTLKAADPIADNDLTTKKYVDDLFGNINTVLATLVDVTVQSDESVSDGATV